MPSKTRRQFDPICFRAKKPKRKAEVVLQQNSIKTLKKKNMLRCPFIHLQSHTLTQVEYHQSLQRWVANGQGSVCEGSLYLLARPWWLSRYRICLQCRRPGFDPWVGKSPWRRAWQPTPLFLPGESRGQRRLVGCSL